MYGMPLHTSCHVSLLTSSSILYHVSQSALGCRYRAALSTALAIFFLFFQILIRNLRDQEGVNIDERKTEAIQFTGILAKYASSEAVAASMNTLRRATANASLAACWSGGGRAWIADDACRILEII